MAYYRISWLDMNKIEILQNTISRVRFKVTVCKKKKLRLEWWRSRSVDRMMAVKTGMVVLGKRNFRSKVVVSFFQRKDTKTISLRIIRRTAFPSPNEMERNKTVWHHVGTGSPSKRERITRRRKKERERERCWEKSKPTRPNTSLTSRKRWICVLKPPFQEFFGRWVDSFFSFFLFLERPSFSLPIHKSIIPPPAPSFTRTTNNQRSLWMLNDS